MSDWQTAFPDAMANNGCDSTCTGYELANHLNFSGQTFTPIGSPTVGEGFAGTFVGNGFQIQNATLSSGTATRQGLFLGTETTAVIRGLGVFHPNFKTSAQSSYGGGIVATHRGKIIGSYVVSNHSLRSSRGGGLVGEARDSATIAHSYARINVDAQNQVNSFWAGGLIGIVATGGATCISSYFHGDLSGTSSVGTPNAGIVAGGTTGGGTLTNTGCTGAGDVRGTTTGSIANMRAATSYDTPATNNPFSTWDETDEDGNTATVDYWNFLNAHNTPVLKAFGHRQNRQIYDYDMDDDGLIEIRTFEQWLNMGNDRNSDGNPETSATNYRNAFPNSMNQLGCRAKDHDSMPSTPDQPTCEGYEMLNDLDWSKTAGGYWTVPGVTASGGSISSGRPGIDGTIKGNGFRMLNIDYNNNARNNNGRASGIFGTVEGRLEGLGAWYIQVYSKSLGGAIAGAVSGKLIGVYAYNPTTWITSNSSQGGGLVGEVIGGTVENSFVQANVGANNDDYGGLIGFMQSGATCKNSYFSGDFGRRNRANLIASGEAVPPGLGFTYTNCYGDTTKAPGVGARGTNGGQTFATMASTDSYTGIYANWNTDEDGDGENDDVWDFGDENELPVLKGYGHDWTFPRARSQSGTQNVNLCTRTIAVANEIIRHLKDDTWRTTSPPITAVPADIVALSDCTSDTDTQNVSVNHLRDFVVTTADNPFRLDPDRTTPASAALTELDADDLAYLVNAAYFDFSDNQLTTIPNYLFQGMKIHQLNLSGNAITNLPHQAFAGLTDASDDYDTWIDLSDNMLTAAGIPYRVFDGVPHITGLSLNNNAITEVNTRWFEYLINLGRLQSTATTLPDVLGLHLGGNEVTKHYYWHKAFPADMLFDEVMYQGTEAGKMLLANIKERMADPKETGAPNLSNLNLDAIDNIQNSVIALGQCPANLVSGPIGAVDINGDPVACEQAPRWTPPWATDTAPEPPDPTTSTTGITADEIVITFDHARATAGTPRITQFQLRYRQLPDDPEETWEQPWRTVPISLTFESKTLSFPGLTPVTLYQFQMRSFAGNQPSRTITFTQGTWPQEWPEGTDIAQAQQPAAESGKRSVRLTFTHRQITNEDPQTQEALAITGYQLRYRPVTADPDDPWTQDWRDLNVDISTPGPKSIIIEPLLEGVRYQFQIRPISVGPTEVATITQATVLALPKANAIRPMIREVSVQAGQQVRLEVDVISLQDTVLNDLADDSDSVMVFRWTESPSGGGTFATPSSDRRVVYTAPDLPGTYTILAEAQPDGICRDHHNAKLGISAEDRARCIATITVRVSRAPGAVEPEADPINPAGLIPTSLTDNAGIAYAVFTPVDGGTFSGEGITISAPAGAIPDQQLLGVAAARSDIPVPTPFPGARLTIAAPYYTVNGVQRTGDAPVSGFALDDPIRACMPIPPMFRADISDVAVISRAQSDGSITILTSSIRQTESGLAACGNIGQLPATVAVANIGVIEATPEPPAPEEDLPDTGGTTPGPWASTWAAIAAALVLTTATIAAITTRRRRRQHAAGIPQHDT